MNEQKNNIQRSLGRIESDIKAMRVDITETKQDVKNLAKKVEILPVIKKQLENHLKHHQIKSDRWFKILVIILNAGVFALLGYLVSLVR